MKTKSKLTLVKRYLVILAVVALYSCKKNYTCQCVQVYTVPAFTTNDGQYHPEEITVNTITNVFKSKKKDAESGCKMGESFNTYPSPYSSQGQGQSTEVVSCELK